MLFRILKQRFVALCYVVGWIAFMSPAGAQEDSLDTVKGAQRVSESPIEEIAPREAHHQPQWRENQVVDDQHQQVRDRPPDRKRRRTSFPSLPSFWVSWRQPM